MNAVTEKLPDPLVFTDAAAAKVKSLIDEEGNPNLKLRVFVQGAAARVSSTASPSTRKPATTTRAWRRAA